MGDSFVSEKSLRIAVLAHGLRVAGGLSVGQNMIAALGRVAPEHMYLLTIPAGTGYEEICREVPRKEVFSYGHSSLIKRWEFERFRLPRLVQEFQPDVVLALGGEGLLKPPCPQAILCHDMHLFYPLKHFGGETLKYKAVKLYNKWALGRQLPGTAMILCQTSAAESRFRQSFTNYTGKTAICPNAVSRFTLDGKLDEEIPAHLAPYADHMKLFYLTKYCAHKNLESIVEVFRKYRKELEGVVAVVTVAADQHPNAPKFLDSIQKWGLTDCIINVGPLQQSSLAGYFNCCQALLMPTLLESFSGSYLEAMHFGLPILTSDLDFAHAVCGDAALYFDPWNPCSIKDAILKLKNEPRLAQDLVNKGEKRLQTMFRSWDDVAQDVVKVLTEINR